MGVQWWQDPDYSHGFVVPLFVGYVLYQRGHKLRQVPLDPSNLGFPVMLGAVALLLVGTLGAQLFVSRFSFLFLLGGMILFFAGWKMLRAVAFPLAFLLLMIPLPALIYNQALIDLSQAQRSSNSMQIATQSYARVRHNPSNALLGPFVSLFARATKPQYLLLRSTPYRS
jgi:exosortase